MRCCELNGVGILRKFIRGIDPPAHLHPIAGVGDEFSQAEGGAVGTDDTGIIKVDTIAAKGNAVLGDRPGPSIPANIRSPRPQVVKSQIRRGDDLEGGELNRIGIVGELV